MIALKKAKIQTLVLYVGLPVLIMIAWDLLIVFGYMVMHWEWLGSNYVPLALYGTAISIIVGFRNNYAYGRWWEARTLWGAIVNRSRTFGRQVMNTMAPRPDGGAAEAAEVGEVQRKLVHYQIAFIHALRQQLRGLDPVAEISGVVSAEDQAELRQSKNVSLSVQQKMGDLLRQARRREWINEWEWQAMDDTLSSLMDSQGGVERIKNTPMPKQYDFFPTLFVQIYCLMLPIGMVTNLGWFTPIGSTVVGFMFLALDKIGRDLEDPFDNKIYDVPLTAICKTIEINLRQLLGETELPAPEKPIDDILW
jgi:ion channel-forming bestrophin family protein